MANDDFFSYVRGSDGARYLKWRDFLDALIEPDQHTIRAAPRDVEGARVIVDYLLPQVLSFPLIDLGLEPLHAAAVDIRDAGAIGFLGNSGAGKSSLAAACLAHGHHLLTDDLLAVVRTEAGWLVQPGPPQLKLLPATARAFRSDRGSSRAMNPFTRKRVFDISAAEHSASPRVLRALFVLRRVERAAADVAISRMSGTAALRALVQNTFNPHGATPARLQRQLTLYSNLLRDVSMYELRLRRGLDLLGAVIAELSGVVAAEAGDKDQTSGRITAGLVHLPG